MTVMYMSTALDIETNPPEVNVLLEGSRVSPNQPALLALSHFFPDETLLLEFQQMNLTYSQYILEKGQISNALN